LMHPVQLLLRALKGGALPHGLHADAASVREHEHHEEY
jgi:hypothetical protein